MKKTNLLSVLVTLVFLPAAIRAQNCFTLTPPSTPSFSAGANPKAVFLGDLDNDGDNDLAVVNLGSSSVAVFKNNGAGTFGPATNYNTGGSPTDIVGADFDGDTDIDLAVSYSSGISVLLNSGPGAFAAAINNSGCYGTVMLHGAFDLDGDNDKDLALVKYASPDTLYIVKNMGAGAFTVFSTYTIGGFSSGLAGKDLDNDLDIDLVVSSNSGNNVRVLTNNGSAVFSAASPITIGSGPTDVILLDVDADGDQDIAASNGNGNSVSILKNIGMATFAAGVSFPANSFPAALVSADFDLDGDLDLAATNQPNNQVSVLLNSGSGTFGSPLSFPVGSGTFPFDLATGDLNGDGRKDLAVVSTITGSVILRYNNSTLNVNVTSAGPQLTAAATGATYQWLKCNPYQPVSGATGQSYTATANGSYAVIITSGACADTSACLLISTVGIKDLEADQTLSIYPNPNSGTFGIDASYEAELSIYNALGELVLSKKLEKGPSQVNLDNCQSGLYTAIIKDISGNGKKHTIISVLK